MTALRVITVGPTGLEHGLRRDATIELVRARTPMDALGELADPIDDDSPDDCVVVVSTVADADDTPAERTAFLAALRSIEPAVRIARTGDGPSVGFDAVLDASSDADALRSIKQRPEPASVVSQTDEPRPGVDASTHLADERIAQALLSGKNILSEAVALIRERTKNPEVTFVAISHLGELPPEGVAVRDPTGRVFGALKAGASMQDARGSASLDALQPHAAWLAGWLRAGALQRELRDAAFRDHLTGAWNRRYFDRFLPTCLDRARERRLPVTLMLFDVDNFKHFNDRFGHSAGDEILTETVRLMDSVIRPHDRVCRIGGDEFAVVFFEPGGPRDIGSSPPTTVFMLAERFQQQICEHQFPKLSREAPGTLTISGGLATFPWDGSTPTELIEHADQLAMRSKQLGKNALTLGPGAERYRAGGCKATTDSADGSDPQDPDLQDEA